MLRTTIHNVKGHLQFEHSNKLGNQLRKKTEYCYFNFSYVNKECVTVAEIGDGLRRGLVFIWC